jgi:hypothetical protein
MRRILFGLMAVSLAACVIGCATGGQPLNWDKADVLDFSKSIKVEIKADVKIPENEIAFIKSDIEQKLLKLFPENKNLKDFYKITVTITRYEEGSAFARFMLIGFGQMYLDGTVDVLKGDTSVVIRNGNFKKNYCLGGIAGGMATIHDDMNAKVAESIAEALKSNQVGER